MIVASLKSVLSLKEKNKQHWLPAFKLAAIT